MTETEVLAILDEHFGAAEPGTVLARHCVVSKLASFVTRAASGPSATLEQVKAEIETVIEDIGEINGRHRHGIPIIDVVDRLKAIAALKPETQPEMEGLWEWWRVHGGELSQEHYASLGTVLELLASPPWSPTLPPTPADREERPCK